MLSVRDIPRLESRATDDRTKLDRWAFPALLAVLTLLCLAHAIYFYKTKLLFASADEAHYSSGALTIANGLRTKTFSGAWQGYRAALGFKAPLVCVPAGILMLFTKSLALPFCMTLIATFAALGLASYSLFRNCFDPFHAAVATTILLCMPLVTGLTHRYYVELLLLLLTVVTLDLLARFEWRSVLGSLLLGAALGLGALTKVTAPLLLLPSIVFSMLMQIREQRSSGFIQAVGPILSRAALAGVIGFAIAWSWYSKNLAAVLDHARIAANATGYFYSHWIAADLSAGPSILITVFALIGIPVLIHRFQRGKEPAHSTRAWIMILLVAVITALALWTSAAKATRFQVTWLPPFALLAVVAWHPLKGTRLFRIGPLVVASFAVLLSLQISFGIFRIAPIGFGDIKVFDSRFPLNMPASYQDNVPADPRDYRFSEAENRIAADAANRFPAGYSAEACTTQSSLIFDHYYFDFLANARKHPVHYMTWWYHCSAHGPEAADYIVHTKNFEQFAPGTENFEYYPHIEEDVAWQIIPYKELFRLQGPAPNAQLIVYTRKQMPLTATNPESAIILEAENFQRGNVSVDKAPGSYGGGIGVVVTPKLGGGFAEYDFRVPETGEYRIQLRYASAVSRPLKLSVDRTTLTDFAAGKQTGGFMPENQMWEEAGSLYLKAGSHTLRVETTDLFPSLDRIALVPVSQKQK